MATEEGVVISSTGAKAWVKTRRSAACEHCQSRGSCQTLGGGNDMQVEAVNSANAVEGDVVVLDFSTVSLLKGTFLIYIFPILCLMLGAGIGVKVSEATGTDRSLVSALAGFGALALSLVFVRLRGTRLGEQEAYQPRIIRVKKKKPDTLPNPDS